MGCTERREFIESAIRLSGCFYTGKGKKNEQELPDTSQNSWYCRICRTPGGCYFAVEWQQNKRKNRFRGLCQCIGHSVTDVRLASMKRSLEIKKYLGDCIATFADNWQQRAIALSFTIKAIAPPYSGDATNFQADKFYWWRLPETTKRTFIWLPQRFLTVAWRMGRCCFSCARWSNCQEGKPTRTSWSSMASTWPLCFISCPVTGNYCCSKLRSNVASLLIQNY